MTREEEPKKITVPVRHFQVQQFYEVSVPDQYWPHFKDALQAVAKLKGKKISFKIKEL